MISVRYFEDHFRDRSLVSLTFEHKVFGLHLFTFYVLFMICIYFLAVPESFAMQKNLCIDTGGGNKLPFQTNVSLEFCSGKCRENLR